MALCDKISEAEHYLKSLLSTLNVTSGQFLYPYLERTGNFYYYLEKTHLLLRVRKTAWDAIDTNPHPLDLFDDNDSTPVANTSEQFPYLGQQQVNYAELRYLSLISYIVPTWAIYDNLFNVVGRILSPKLSRMENNPKLPDLYRSGGENNFGIFIDSYTHNQFAWSCAFSYEIRNWLVHEGSTRGVPIKGNASCPIRYFSDVGLFFGDDRSDDFILSDDVKKYIKDTTCKDYQDSHRDKDRFNTLWNKGDLLKLLEYANGEIDVLFEKLLPWAVETMKSQIKFFT